MIARLPKYFGETGWLYVNRFFFKKENVLNKKVYRIMNIIVAAVLMLGGYSNVLAQSLNPPSVPILALPVNNTLVTNLTPRLDWNDSSVPAGTTFQKYELQLAINNKQS